MKKVIFISIAAFLLIMLALVIFVIPIRRIPAPQTAWERWQVTKAMEDVFVADSYQYYFGKYNGYYIVSGAKMTCDFCIETIGDYTFCFNAYNIGVWKDRIRFDLEYAYEQGKISDEDLGKIHEYHIQTLRDFELEEIKGIY